MIMDGITLALVAVALVILLVWMALPSAAHRRFSKAPGPSGVPIFGNALQIPSNSPGFFRWIQDLFVNYRQCPVVKVMLMRRRFAFVWRAESVEAILSSNKEITKSDDYKYMETWLGEGLLTSTGEKWFAHRRTLTSSFHFRILGDFLQVFNEQAEILANKLNEDVDKEAFDISSRVTLCTLDILCDSAMGKCVGAQENSESEYVKAVQTLGELFMHRFRTPYLWPKWVFFNLPVGKRWNCALRAVKGFARGVIDERYRQFLEDAKESGESSTKDSTGRKKRMAFLDTLLSLVNDVSGFTLDDVQEEVDTFMFAGHDTTSATISWAIYNIGSHPEVQEKVQKEVMSVLGDGTREITDGDLKQLKYLECVIKETMRLYATVPVISRVLQDDMNIAGVDVPKGTTVSIAPLLLHHDERYFPNPSKFDPDRFTLENSAGRPPYAFVPFSAGSRNCIGQKFAFMEMKVVLSHILRRYHIETVHEPSEMSPIIELVLRAGNGIHVKLTHKV